MAQDLLLEIGTEELPAGYVLPATADLRESARKVLQEARIGCEQVKTWGTPRRLVLLATDVEEKQEDLVQELQGPAKSVAFDQDGHPTKAARGFAQSRGVSPQDLMVKETPRGEYVFARVRTPGRFALEIFQALLPNLICALSFPKSMRWGSGDLRFARPIRWILALLGDQVISFTLGDVSSGKQTRGHRQLSPGPYQVSSAGDYWQVMDQAGIIVDQEVRRQAIWEGMVKAAKASGGRPLPDEALLDTVTHLVEVPTPLCGHFDQGYLSLPRGVLTTAMSEHQKCFAVVDGEDHLLPLFLTVSNGDPQQAQLILKGYQKVLAARLEDARFFFQEDQKSPLADRVEALKAVVFQEDLGTMYQKTQRIVTLTGQLSAAAHLPASVTQAAARAALLCKADLVTLMVAEKEFSQLQGYMGQQYALVSGESQPVAQAIFEHYLPRYAEDALPESLPGALVATADKLDTIVGCFGVGLIPTGSQDPYALRRSALGVIRILLRHDLTIDLHQLVDWALDLLVDQLKGDHQQTRDGVLAFFRQRVESQLMEMDLDPDVVDAVLAADDRIVPDVLRRGRALQAFRSQAGFGRLVQGSKRVANILRGQDVSGQPDPTQFREKAEKDLYAAAEQVRRQIDEQAGGGNYPEALRATLQLVEPIDDFFEKILVMDTDKAIRANRLRLLGAVKEIFLTVADYSKIAIRGEGESDK